MTAELAGSTVSILFLNQMSSYYSVSVIVLINFSVLASTLFVCHRNSLGRPGRLLTCNNSTIWPPSVPYRCEAPMAALREFFIHICKRRSSKSYHSGKCGQKVTWIPGLFIWDAKFIGSLSKACNIRNMSTVNSLNLT